MQQLLRGWLGWPRQLFVGQLWFERLVFHAPLLDLSSRSEFGGSWFLARFLPLR